MIDLVEKIGLLHEALTRAQIPHAFGGALALAWCTNAARGTIDIDVNLFVGGEGIEATLDALPEGVVWKQDDLQRLKKDLQHRLWWDHTPVDVFFNSTEYHDAVATRIRWEQFAGASLPFLSCVDLAVFKVIFDRTKDWADIEAMQEAGTLDYGSVRATVTSFVGSDDARLARLDAIVASAP